MSAFTLRGRTIAAYVPMTAPLAALGLPLVVYVQPFYISSLGLNQDAVAFVLFAARLLDIIVDPIIGWLGDSTRTRWGRRRPWIIASVPPFVAGVFLLFIPPQDATITYFAIWVVVSYLAYSVASISHIAWGAELSAVYHERSRVQGWREFGAVAGFLLVLALPVGLEAVDPGASLNDKLELMGWFICISLPITVALLLAFVDEPPLTESKGDKLDVTAAIRLIASNDALRRLLAADLLQGLAPGITGALFIWMVGYYYELPGASSTLLFIYFVAGLFFIPAWIKLSYRMSKHRTLCVAMFYAIAISPLLLLLPKADFLVLAIAFVVFGVTYGSAGFLLRSMMADVVDMDTLATGGERAGLFYSLLVLTAKLGYAVSALVIPVVLTPLGFDLSPGATNTPEAIQSLAYVFVGLPMVFMVLTVLVMWNYPIDEFKQREVREAIARKRDAAAAEIAAMKVD